MNLRVATLDDVPALRTLIELSARALSAAFYSQEQIDAAVVHVFGVDTQLISDGTYFVIDAADGPAAAGGWSARRTLYGGDQTKIGSDPGLDPRTEAARIRAFFVHPHWARQGLGRQLFAACAQAAWGAGFRNFELMATRPGEPLYDALGFTVLERVVVTLPGGVEVPFARMSRAIEPPARTPHRWYTRPVIFVADVHRAIRFYVDKLGFDKGWHEGDGTGTVCQVNHGECEIILCEDPARSGKGRLFIELTVEGLADLRDVVIERGVATQEIWWGSNTVRIDDPDGNELFFPRTT
jgi:GNAT superfamily N-acetyltransferase/catechol 2,3-dioxygenase-like lactoylglutathione lyase family enzyme